MPRRTWILLTALSLALVPATGAAAGEGPATVVEAYHAAVADTAWSTARACWSAAYLEDAASLGVTYAGVPCPWDLASPAIRAHLAGFRPDLEIRDVDAAASPATVTVASTDDTGSWSYALVREDGAWRLADRTWAVGRTWPTRSSRYCRLIGPEVREIDPRSIAHLDAFIETCARRFGMDDADLAHLARVRIPYHVADDATVAELTGYPTKGMANLAAGSVVSSHFPHDHELVHLLVNVALQEVPLWTHPLLQEGLACLVGGRWGRSPEVILYTGWFHLDLGLARVADVLTWEGFHGGGADGSYALAALVCDLVVERAGWDGLMRLHADLSGPLADPRGMDGESVARAVGGICSLLGEDPVLELEAAVREQAERRRRCGIEPAMSGLPATVTLQPGPLGADFSHGEGEGRLSFSLAPGDSPRGILLSAPPAEMAGTSALFREQWPDHSWDGTRWGLVCRPGSVGLYDYVTNRLVGTWVADFSGESPLGSGQSSRLEFTVTPPPGWGEVPPGGPRPGPR